MVNSREGLFQHTKGTGDKRPDRVGSGASGVRAQGRAKGSALWRTQGPVCWAMCRHARAGSAPWRGAQCHPLKPQGSPQTPPRDSSSGCPGCAHPLWLLLCPRYDRSRLSLKEISNVQYVSCMNPTAGSFTINPRLQVKPCPMALVFGWIVQARGFRRACGRSCCCSISGNSMDL